MFMVGILLRFGSIAAWIFHIVACMGGCVGSSLRPKLVSTVDEPFNREEAQLQRGSISDGFWTTSNCDIDISAFQSQGSTSSFSTAMHDPRRAGSSDVSTEFVNHGLLLWNQSRKRWIGSRKPHNQVHHLREPKLSWNASYDSLLGSNKPFRKPIPLAEMVDFLVDIWEQDGMYD